MEGRRPKILLAAPKKSGANAFLKKMEGLAGLVQTAALGKVLAQLPRETPDCLVLMTDAKGQLDRNFLEGIKHFDDNLPLIVLSPSKDVDQVVRFMKKGIYDFFNLPANAARLKFSIQNACRMYHLTKRVFLLENQLGAQTKLDEIIGTSPAMQTIFQTIRNVAGTNATVLITGESGTGKELVAKAVHRLSKRASRHFVDINCGAIPKELLENELFGHERGAYTGAEYRYIGCCERANGGTLFLDEISEMELSLQVKLLRFLQERSFMRVGGVGPISVDVAIMAATNKNLSEGVAQGSFREDLFYRLNVVQISVPPLRERKEDIPLLAKHFLERYSHKNEKLFLGFSEEAMESLLDYDWPGNVRELENTIERAVVLHNDTKIKVQHLPPPLSGAKRSPAADFQAEGLDRISPPKVLPLNLVERYAIEQALKVCTGNIAKAAQRLQIGQATLYRKIKQYGIQAG